MSKVTDFFIFVDSGRFCSSFKAEFFHFPINVRFHQWCPVVSFWLVKPPINKVTCFLDIYMLKLILLCTKPVFIRRAFTWIQYINVINKIFIIVFQKMIKSKYLFALHIYKVDGIQDEVKYIRCRHLTIIFLLQLQVAWTITLFKIWSHPVLA